MNVTVTQGSSVVVDVSQCDASGVGINGADLRTPPSNGTVTFQLTNTIDTFTYTPTNPSATSDSFVFDDTLNYNDPSNLVTVNITILPSASAISITPTSFSFTGGSAVSTSFTASGGTGSYAYAVTSGSLPAGLSLAPSGALTGTPSAYGNYSFTVTATDSSNATGTQSYTGSVAPGSLTISPASPLSNATISIPYSVSLSGNNGISPYSFSITDPSNLPPGITLSGSSLSGTPTTAGTYNFHIAVTDSETDASGALSHNTVVLPYQLTVQTAPTITVTPNAVSDATVGVVYTPVTFTASGGTSAYTYSISAGSLPAGMTLASDGTLSGTPTQAGAFNFTVQAKDANNFTGTTSSISMTVNAPTITVGPGVISNMQVGVPYSQQFTASGGTQGSGYTFAASGTVPVGLTLSSTGLLSGTPTSATSSASFTVTATDHSTGTGAPFSGSQGYTVSVAAPTLSISPASGTGLSAATQGSSYSQAFTASGGTPNYSYQITGGTLPNGLSLSNGGQLSGTPTEAGTFNFNVTATDSSSGTGSPFTVSGSYTLDVQPIVPVASPVTINVPYSSTANVVSTSFSGGTPTSVAVASPASHGTATASGTSITYTPTAGYTGPDSFTYTGTNSAGTSAPATVSITVAAPTLAITSSSGGTSLTATVGQSFTQTFTFSGGQAPYQSYSITGIPAGLSVTGFNNTSITISGTPTVSGSFTLGVSGTDSSTGTNAPFTANQAFSLQISPASMSVSPVSGTLTHATVGTAYSQLITASGGISPYTYTVTSGSLPAGMTLTTAGTLMGTPSAAGTFQFRVTATDSSTGAGSPATASANYTLTVDPPTITVSPGTLPSLQQGIAFSQQLSASGGTATYSYAVTAGSLPASLSLSSTGLLSGTPSTYGTFHFTVTATDSSTGTGPFAGSQSYTVTVSAQSPTITTTSVPNGTVGVAYTSTNIHTTSGNPPYSYTVSAGTLPPGLSLSGSGALTGTPTAGGTYTFTVQVTDAASSTVTQAYTVTIGAPTVTVSPSTLPGGTQGSSYSQTIGASGGTAPYTYAITSGSLPAGLSLGKGGTLSGTPTAYGTFHFTVTATDASTGSGPYTGSQSYSLAIAAQQPVANNDTATTPSQAAVTIPVTDNDAGPIDSIAVASAPGHGTATVSGTSVVYTPAGTFYGTDSFTYTASGPGGTSAPATVTVTVTPLPAPTVTNQSLQVPGGQSVQIDPTAGATGGPFTTVAIVSAPSVGTATVSGLTISYRAPANGSGTDSFTYTLSNAYGTSSPATVTVTIIPRPDPTRDREVMGLLDAQTQATRRFMRGQIDNLQARLENLHDGHPVGGFQDNLSMMFGGGRASMLHGPAPMPTMDLTADGMQPGRHSLSARDLPGQDGDTRTGHAGHPGLGLWASGALNFGTQKLGGSHNGIDFNTSGLTLGADTRLSGRLAIGGGVGFGHDASDVGDHGSRSTADAYNVAGYASYRPGDDAFVDGVLGYQWLSFGAHRYVTMDGRYVDGSRHGTQVFGSLSAGFEHHRGTWMISPYGRLDIARASLDAYTEHGDPLYALHYDRQTVDTTSGTLGVRMNGSIKRVFGVIEPMLRVAYRHDFQGSSDASMRYADFTGPLYRAVVGGQSRNHAILGLGVQTRTRAGLTFRIEYQNTFERSSRSNQSLLLHLEKSFK